MTVVSPGQVVIAMNEDIQFDAKPSVYQSCQVTLDISGSPIDFQWGTGNILDRYVYIRSIKCVLGLVCLVLFWLYFTVL